MWLKKIVYRNANAILFGKWRSIFQLQVFPPYKCRHNRIYGVFDCWKKLGNDIKWKTQKYMVFGILKIWQSLKCFCKLISIHFLPFIKSVKYYHNHPKNYCHFKIEQTFFLFCLVCDWMSCSQENFLFYVHISME